ncbi:MAG TPA: DUF3458 domain-containing protein [Rhizobiales bacterium]|nr:DUF3458 domain-containing protein [Hyphomicrobiales bacterium]
MLRAHQFPEDAGPLAHPVRPQSYMEINNFYTATVYEKGAEVVRMLHTLVGKENFRAAMDRYFATHDGEAATVEDFVKCMANASGRNFEHFFQWYNEAGTPHVVAEGSYDEARQTYTLDLSQVTMPTPGQPSKPPFHIPLVVGLIGKDGCDMTIASELIELTMPKQQVVFENIPERPVLSLNRSFSAPIVLNTNMTPADQLFQMAHDSDSFNRFEAAQEVAMDMIIATMKNPQTDPSQLDEYAGALRSIINDASLEAAFIAQMLALPGEATIAGRIGENVDPEAIHNAHCRVSHLIGKALESDLKNILQQPVPHSYSPDAAAAGQRSLRHTALGFIGAYDEQEGSDLAYSQFISASNMSDEIGALNTLIQLDTSDREKALEEFFQKHQNDHLLVDKWFALNAQVPFPETLGRVRELMEHPSFSFSKPNTVRALLGGFAMANPVCFNEIDGSGYELFADAILKLDKINPQVAARLSGAFRSWQMLEPGRAGLAKTALEQINSTPGLSKDTFEITQKSLA